MKDIVIDGGNDTIHVRDINLSNHIVICYYKTKGPGGSLIKSPSSKVWHWKSLRGIPMLGGFKSVSAAVKQARAKGYSVKVITKEDFTNE